MTETNNIAHWRPGSIKNLTPGLVERGKIKIGMKGAARQSRSGNTFQAPQKLDHFIVTATEFVSFRRRGWL